MTTYESDIKTISSNEEVVFNLLSDLTNLEKLKSAEGAPAELKDVRFDKDSCHFTVNGLGEVGFRIIEREPNKTIKLETENIPISINAWIQLKEVAENDTRMKLTLKADLPAMVKMMVDKKLKEGINMVADVIAKAASNTANG
ncbi:SRPBCC family protein [Paludibacter sp. 221]|uniref:SRPBCC family protein n=1 Tax=Paludibacter sp. 221 TaxID=2302939 RepID=UPI0013D2D5C7|nr:SRPBCC family protein [Paludibacter sp. 221]NDV46507.1 SRPBCC family protein [Paludibacter sp. 221]